jgi:hypothetical protein
MLAGTTASVLAWREQQFSRNAAQYGSRPPAGE